MNKQDLISKIKQLDGVTQDERSYLINLVNTKKKYGLVWEDKPEDVEEQLRNNLPVLKEVKDKAIVTGEDNPNHILIEGDNLHALTALTFTHEGRIDVIYIDPPYNTGNKDFKYNDSFVDKEDSYRHSKWLSFMDKRLRIAKRLLSENGVIFISIDDNEQAQLKMLCDEIFQEDNFIANFLWEKTSTPPALSKKVRKKSEYVLCFERIRDNSNYSQGLVDGGDVPLLNSGNNEAILVFPANSIIFKIPDGLYTENGQRKVQIIEELVVENGYNKNVIKLKGNFKWQQSMLEKEVVLGTTFIIKTNFFSIRFQRDISNLKTKTPSNILNSESSIGTNESAKKEIEELVTNDYFDYPKPVSLIAFLLKLKAFNNPTILDFFAGSGTTLHATMALNEEDGGNRQCILVTNNENNICEEVTYERNKRVIKGYTNTKGVNIEGLKNNNLRYFKSEFVPSSKTEQNKRLLTQASTNLLCIKEDCYQDITEKEGFNSLHCSIFTNGIGKYLIVVYHSRQINTVCEQLTNYIKGLETTEKVKLYAFSPEKETLLEDFYEVQDKIYAVPLPEAIYNAYRATFRTLKLDKKPMVVITPNDVDEDGESTLFDNQDEE
jgi:adenine-specific DNA-methyltransferase